MLGSTRRIGALLTLLALVTVGAACSDDGKKDNSEPTTTRSATSAPATSDGRPTTDVRVYFTRAEKVATAGRSVEPPALARGALEALLDGPNGLETGIGMVNAIPTATKLRSVAIQGGKATVDLSDEFQSGGGGLSMQLRVAQVVFTLTQFDSVETVSIRIDGVDVTALGEEGVPAVDLDRADFENVTPFILVESPVPGQRVSSPLTISGMANTFEANVRYSVTAGEQVLTEGFTTASVGSGIWGTFSVAAQFSQGRGPGTVTAWEDSAKDGSRINEYVVPVQLG